jgi:PKD repeat protein
MKKLLLSTILIVTLSGCTKEPTAMIYSIEDIAPVGSTVRFNNYSINADHIEWSISNSQWICKENEINYTFNSVGSYTVTLTAYSRNERKKDIAQKRIEIY